MVRGLNIISIIISISLLLNLGFCVPDAEKDPLNFNDFQNNSTINQSNTANISNYRSANLTNTSIDGTPKGINDTWTECLDPEELLKTTAVYWIDLGDEFYSEKDYASAQKSYENAIKKDPLQASIWYNKGNAFFKQKMYEDAINDYKQAIKLNPKLAPAWKNLAISLNDIGHTEDARNACTEAAKLGLNCSV